MTILVSPLQPVEMAQGVIPREELASQIEREVEPVALKPHWKRKKKSQQKGKENGVIPEEGEDQGKRKRVAEVIEDVLDGEDRNRKALRVLSENQSTGAVTQPRRQP